MLKNMDVLKAFTKLKHLELAGCSALQNINAITSLSSLQSLYLSGCPALQDVSTLTKITSLHWIELRGCVNIPVASLRELRAALPNIVIVFPDGTTNPPQ